MFKILAAIIALTTSANVMAKNEITLNSLLQNRATKSEFIQMIKGHKLPNWITSGSTGTPAQSVKLGTETYQVLRACKPHDCASERIAIIWSEKLQQMSGVFSKVDENTSQETLTWLNINDELSIDGKTVLFAALSGSLENHPKAFNYR